MLDKIKSAYFYKQLFSFIDESQKLQIIVHNKNLQNLLEISLINYKIFSQRYIVFEEKNKIKMYNSISDKLIYEGEYLNGKKHGKGNEYDFNGKLKYEGIYLYDYKLKGKELYNDGKIKFEGEYLFDLYWTGKEYDKDIIL